MMPGPTRAVVRLHRDDGGQISALAVIAAAIFAGLLVLIMNTGYETSGKIQLQNTADATAISGATWVARGLNLVSLNNVTQTQLLALYLLIPALNDAATAAIEVYTLEIAACALTGPFAPGCALVFEFQRESLELAQSISFYPAKVGAIDTHFLWVTMQGFGYFSQGIVASFPALAEAEALRIARQNEADVGGIVPAPLADGSFQWKLPARKGSLRPDLCDPTYRGSPSSNSRGYRPLYGYGIGEGTLQHYGNTMRWVTYPWLLGGMPLFFEAFKEANYRELCGGSGTAPTYEKSVKTLGECQAAHGTGYWSVRYFRTTALPVEQPNILTTLSDDDPRLADRPVTSENQVSCSWTPPGRQVATNVWRDATETREMTGVDDQGRPIYAYRYSVTEYRFVRGGIVANAPPSESIGAEDNSDSDPFPFLLGSTPTTDDAIRSELRYLAVTYRNRPVWVSPSYFVSPYGAYRYTYAQAKVYNPTAFDLFTQDWRVSLQPADMIEDGSLARAMGGDFLSGVLAKVPAASGAFGGGMGLLTGGAPNFLGSVNNH